MRLAAFSVRVGLFIFLALSRKIVGCRSMYYSDHAISC